MKLFESILKGAIVVAIAVSQSAYGADCSATSVGFTPINDLGAGSYLGFQGGLYPQGSNQRPGNHEVAGLAIARAIEPMDSNGTFDSNGKYVMLSIGMSNTGQEFEAFLLDANADPDKDPNLVIVNGAQGGATAMDWARGFSPVWDVAMQKLSEQNVSASQVAVVWAKFANSASGQSSDNYRVALQDDIAMAINNLRDNFPNLKLAYLSSRIYAGYATTSLNPEPFAYESGFVVKWTVENQLNGDASLNFDAAKGMVNAPWLSWGPYFWADGLTPRSDGLIWRCSDVREDDGTHPSDEGKDKVGSMLHDFFKTDVTAQEWFLANPGTPVDTVAPMAPDDLNVEAQ
jgi:hypothetical protein